MTFFPSLAGFEATRQTLHKYSNAIGVVPRAYGIAHPKWWHISLKVRPSGLTTDNVPLPDGGALSLRMDLQQHQIVLQVSNGDTAVFDMTAGLTGTQMGDTILTAVRDYGLTGPFVREKFESDDPRSYDPEMAGRYFTALINANTAFTRHQYAISGETGPVQLWPHGFDLACEWFGTRVETYEEHGEVQEYPSQINLGFYPGNESTAPYFYSNPWPFEADVLLKQPLPEGASWHTEGWEGSIFPYAALVNDDNALERLQTFAKAVYDVASPTLLA